MATCDADVVYIYGLTDPLNKNCIFYIGQSLDPDARLIQHMRLTSASRAQRSVLRRLMHDDLMPGVRILTTVSKLDADAEEKRYIEDYAAAGVLLTNRMHNPLAGMFFVDPEFDDYDDIRRRNRGYALDLDLVAGVKSIAAKQQYPLYEAMEQALRDFIAAYEAADKS